MSARQTFHVECQALFYLTNKNKYFKVYSDVLAVSALRVLKDNIIFHILNGL